MIEKPRPKPNLDMYQAFCSKCVNDIDDYLAQELTRVRAEERARVCEEVEELIEDFKFNVNVTGPDSGEWCVEVGEIEARLNELSKTEVE